jgi:hypothetical protein
MQGCRDPKHSDTWHNDTKRNDTHHKSDWHNGGGPLGEEIKLNGVFYQPCIIGLLMQGCCDAQHNDTWHNNTNRNDTHHNADWHSDGGLCVKESNGVEFFINLL